MMDGNYCILDKIEKEERMKIFFCIMLVNNTHILLALFSEIAFNNIFLKERKIIKIQNGCLTHSQQSVRNINVIIHIMSSKKYFFLFSDGCDYKNSLDPFLCCVI